MNLFFCIKFTYNFTARMFSFLHLNIFKYGRLQIIIDLKDTSVTLKYSIYCNPTPFDKTSRILPHDLSNCL